MEKQNSRIGASRDTTLIFTILLLALTIFGFALRFSFFIGSDFPLHDGGFFYVMIRDLISNRFILPDFSSYNQADIPYIYPPLGLYITGWVNSLFAMPLLQLFRILPLAVSVLTIPALYFLAFELLEERWSALAAVAVYSLLPMGYKWIILGGGVTRAFGVLFSILALLFVIRYFRSKKWFAALLGGLFCGFTILSHPECAWFLFYSLTGVVFVRLSTREKKILPRATLVVLITAAVIFPWLLRVFVRHGWTILQPLSKSGFSRLNDIVRFFVLDWSGELFFPVFTLFAVFGIARSIRVKNWFLVIWLPLVFFLQGRAANQRAVIPLAILAGLGFTAAINYLRAAHKDFFKPVKIFVLIVSVYLYSLIGSMVSAANIAAPQHTQHLESLEWINANTPPDAEMLVITGNDWVYDRYSEWMSALTGRVSLSLVQGYEWLPGFPERITQHEQIRVAYAQGLGNLMDWMNENGVRADYLVLPMNEPKQIDSGDPEPTLHGQDILLYPGVLKAFENERVLIVDLRSMITY